MKEIMVSWEKMNKIDKALDKLIKDKKINKIRHTKWKKGKNVLSQNIDE